MRNRTKILRQIALQFTQDAEKKAEKNKTNGKLIRRVIFFIIGHFGTIVLISIPLILLLGFLIPLVYFIQSFLGGGETGTYRPTNINGVDYKSYFSKEFMDIPYGIPAERGIITRGFDDGKNLFGIRTYSKHTGVDIARTYGDKNTGYSPHELSTLRGVLIRAETFDVDPTNKNYYIYHRTSFIDGSAVTSDDKIKIVNSKSERPYGQHVVVGSLDGQYYTLYGHMYAVNENILNQSTIERGDDLGIMGNTGNSFGIHLHYEVRYCGGNNEDHHKPVGQCRPINPLGNNDILGTNYLGYNPALNSRMVSAGNDDTIANQYMSVDEDAVFKNKYKEVCNSIRPFLINSKVDCNVIFPVIYQNRNNELFPVMELSDNELIAAGEQYLITEYSKGSELLTPMDIINIAGLENIQLSNYTKENLLKELGKRYSHGKFLNQKKNYKVSLINTNANNIELNMVRDVIQTFNTYSNSNSNVEKMYQKYYSFMSGYKDPKTNPYIYNKLNKNTIFMYIKNKNGDIVSLYKDDGLLALYNKAKGLK